MKRNHIWYYNTQQQQWVETSELGILLMQKLYNRKYLIARSK